MLLVLWCCDSGRTSFVSFALALLCLELRIRDELILEELWFCLLYSLSSRRWLSFGLIWLLSLLETNFSSSNLLVFGNVTLVIFPISQIIDWLTCNPIQVQVPVVVEKSIWRGEHKVILPVKLCWQPKISTIYVARELLGFMGYDWERAVKVTWLTSQFVFKICF